METLSRVKRYEDLRKQIEDDSIGTDTPPEEKLQSYAKRLNEIDPSIFKKVTITEEEPNTPQRERVETSIYDDNDSTMQEFRNEYLDDFINEVREYNIKKGNRESENTQIDILNRLNAVSRAKRSDYIQNIEDEVKEVKQEEAVIQNREDIAAQVKSLLEEEALQPEPLIQRTDTKKADESKPAEATVEVVKPTDVTPQELKKESPAKQPKTKMTPSAQPVNVNQSAAEKKEKQPVMQNKPKPKPVAAKELQAEVEREQKLHQKLVEETQQLRVQLNEYEDDLNDLSEGVEKTNKMLNVILGCLILALLVIIGIIIYWVIQAGGLV
ncbi:hypothetical protein D5266_00870 [bacterium c-19]|nr:hypothetical protein [bacterium c-19]